MFRRISDSIKKVEVDREDLVKVECQDESFRPS